MSALSIQSLSKRYDHDKTIVDTVSLDVKAGEFVSLLGPSGCGKTTILRMVAGLLDPSGGRILIGGKDVTDVPVNRRNIGLVFQSYALFPHLTVFENVAFGLRRQGVRGSDLKSKVEDALARVRLASHGERYPRQLSGGQQQRVALARSIAPRPAILLFDEPLSNLDAQLRDEMQIELKRLQRELNLTSLFVTHDQHEAMSLSDRICLLASGKIQQYDTPEEVYFRPANGFVAGFIGSPNKLAGTVLPMAEACADIALGPSIAIRAKETNFLPGSKVSVTIRQEDVDLQPATVQHPQGSNLLQGQITLRIFSGSMVQFLVSLGDGFEILARLPSSDRRSTLGLGEAVTAVIDPAKVFVSPYDVEN